MKKQIPTETMSRQRRWQLKKVAEGKCQICSKPLFSSSLCEEHTLRGRDRNFVRYRDKVGIDVDAPLKKAGRTRTEDKEVVA